MPDVECPAVIYSEIHLFYLIWHGKNKKYKWVECQMLNVQLLFIRKSIYSI